MKKILLLLLTSLCMSSNVFSYDSALIEKKITQVILRGVPTKQPRGVSSTSLVSCYYCDGLLCVDCYVDAEMIHVSVTNADTGERYDEYEGDCCQSISLTVPHTPGVYYVEIEIDSALLYGYYRL